MKVFSVGLLVLSFVLPSFSYSAEAFVTNTTENWSVRPPFGFTKEVTSNGVYKMTTFYAPERNASFRVMTTDVDFGTTDKKSLEGYVKIKKETLKKDLSNYAQVSDTKTTLGGAPARLVEFTWISGGYKNRSQAIMASYGGRVYEIAVTSSEQTWHAAYPLMEYSLSTFVFAKKGAVKEGTLSVSVKADKGLYGKGAEDVGVGLHDPETGETLQRVILKKGKATFKGLEQGKT